MAKAFSGNDKVGAIANEYPWSREIFKKHGIYVSNEGDHQIMDAVGDNTSSVSAVLEDLNSAYQQHVGPADMGE